jgi:hypothetical protein
MGNEIIFDVLVDYEEVVSMFIAFYVTIALFILIALFFVVRVVMSTYLEFRGARVVTCPETKAAAGVEVDARHAAITALINEEPELRLTECSRWPEREDCGQECVKQIEAAPMECLVLTKLTEWYQEKSCIRCGKAFGELNWFDHKPVVMSPDHKLVEWREIRAEHIPQVLSTHEPVCWDCYIAEAFRGEHPDLVVDRPWKDEESHRHV